MGAGFSGGGGGRTTFTLQAYGAVFLGKPGNLEDGDKIVLHQDVLNELSTLRAAGDPDRKSDRAVVRLQCNASRARPCLIQSFSKCATSSSTACRTAVFSSSLRRETQPSCRNGYCCLRCDSNRA